MFVPSLLCVFPSLSNNVRLPPSMPSRRVKRVAARPGRCAVVPLSVSRMTWAFRDFGMVYGWCMVGFPSKSKDAMWIRRVWRGFVAHLDCRKVRPVVSKWPSQTLFHLNYSLVHYNLICHSDTWLQGISAGLRSQDAGSSGIPPGQGWG